MSKVRELSNVDAFFARICAEYDAISARQKQLSIDLMTLVLRLDYLIPENSPQKAAIRELTMLPMSIQGTSPHTYYLDPFSNQWFWIWWVDESGTHIPAEIAVLPIMATISEIKEIMDTLASEAERIDRAQDTKEERR